MGDIKGSVNVILRRSGTALKYVSVERSLLRALPPNLAMKAVKPEQSRRAGTAVWAWTRKVFSRTAAQLKRRYGHLEHRYGRRYTQVLLVVACIAFFLPLPGSTAIAVAAVVLVAEIHRAVSRIRRPRNSSTAGAESG